MAASGVEVPDEPTHSVTLTNMHVFYIKKAPTVAVFQSPADKVDMQGSLSANSSQLCHKCPYPLWLHNYGVIRAFLGWL